MNAVFLIIWSLLPGLLWLQWIYKRDTYQPEPLGTVGKAFGIGMLLTLPAGILNETFGMTAFLTYTVSPNLMDMAALSFGVIGPAEEGLKFGALYLFFFHHKDFDEPIDGLVYAGSIALGFASAENILYVISHGNEVVLLRGITAVPAHFLFAASFGYAMGRMKAPGTSRGPSLLWGWGVAAIAHGAYDFMIFGAAVLGIPSVGYLGLALVLLGLAIKWKAYVEELAFLSPFRPHTQRGNCPECGMIRWPDGQYCEGCGLPLLPVGAQ